MFDIIKPEYLVGALIYSILGIIVFWVSFIVIDKITPYNLWKGIVEEKNLALAVVVASMCIAIALIISSAIHG